MIAALLATGRRYWRVNLLLVCVAGLLVGVASSIGMQLGLRYILPAMPLLYLFSAQGAQALWNGRSVARRSLVVAGTIALCVGLREHPHHLAYFNEAAGGLRGGRNHLADSNLDWGQDLRELDAWLESHGVEQIGLAYFGMFPPSALGIDYQLPPSPAQVAALGRPAAGWYAVSVNFVLGRPHTIRRPDDSIARTGYQEYGYFRRYAPVTTIGGSIDVYHIEAGGRGR